MEYTKTFHIRTVKEEKARDEISMRDHIDKRIK